MNKYIFTYLNSTHEIEAESYEYAYIELIKLVGALDAGNYELTY